MTTFDGGKTTFGDYFDATENVVVLIEEVGLTNAEHIVMWSALCKRDEDIHYANYDDLKAFVELHKLFPPNMYSPLKMTPGDTLTIDCTFGRLHYKETQRARIVSFDYKED
jgi:hypothetical protein